MMLRVTIDLVPWGDESRKQTLHTIVIANDGSGTDISGNYHAVASQARTNRPWKFAEVHGFPRKRRNSIDLLYRVLAKMVGGRN